MLKIQNQIKLSKILAMKNPLIVISNKKILLNLNIVKVQRLNKTFLTLKKNVGNHFFKK